MDMQCGRCAGSLWKWIRTPQGDYLECAECRIQYVVIERADMTVRHQWIITVPRFPETCPGGC